MKLILLLITPLFINSCASDEQKSAEKFIKETIEITWDGGIPLDDLLYAYMVCQKHSGYESCDVVYTQITDVSLAFKSCTEDQRSSLCQAVVFVISKHPIYKALPISDAVVLPQNPFYWSLPTKALESQASNFDYRLESINWWLNEWSRVIWLLTFLLLIIFGLFRYWNYRQKIQLEINLENMAKVERDAEDERLLEMIAQHKKRDEVLRLESEKVAELAKQKLIEESNRVALQLKVLNENSEKLANEKAEADAFLNAVFKRKN